MRTRRQHLSHPHGLLCVALGLLELACGRVGYSSRADEDAGTPPSGTYEVEVPDLMTPSNYGSAVDLSEELLIVGAPKTTRDGKVNAGVAYLFPRNTDGSLGPGVLLAPTTSEEEALFGYAVAVTNNYAVVSAYNADFDDDADVGAAYVFTESEGAWSVTQTLRPADGSPYDRFGIDVEAAHETIVVGANFADPLDSESGAAYVFESAGGIFEQTNKLVPIEGGAQSSFGASVDLSSDSDRIIIGALFHDVDDKADVGAAYIFERQGSFVETAMLKPSVGQPSSFFGEAVAIDNRWAMVGAPQEDAAGEDSGAVYFFDGDDNWSESTSFPAPAGAAGNQFGASLAIYRDLAVVGEHLNDSDSQNSGKAHAYRYDGTSWADAPMQSPSTGAASHLSEALSVRGNSVCIGAHLAAPAGRVILIHLAP